MTTQTHSDALISEALDLLSARGCDRDGASIRASAPDECATWAVCGICGGPVPEQHVHGFVAIDVEAFAKVTGEMMGESAADSVRRFAASMSEHPRDGFCSEGCAIMWLSGTPTQAEIASTVEAPATFIVTHSL